MNKFLNHLPYFTGLCLSTKILSSQIRIPEYFTLAIRSTPTPSIDNIHPDAVKVWAQISEDTRKGICNCHHFRNCVPSDSWIQPCNLLHLASKKQNQSHSQSKHICTHQLRGGRPSSRAVILFSNPNQKRSHRPASTQGMLWTAQQMQGIQTTSSTVKRWEALSSPWCQVIRWLQSYALWSTARLWTILYNFSQITEVSWETSVIKQDLVVRKLFLIQPILFPLHHSIYYSLHPPAKLNITLLSLMLTCFSYIQTIMSFHRSFSYPLSRLHVFSRFHFSCCPPLSSRQQHLPE